MKESFLQRDCGMFPLLGVWSVSLQKRRNKSCFCWLSCKPVTPYAFQILFPSFEGSFLNYFQLCLFRNANFLLQYLDNDKSWGGKIFMFNYCSWNKEQWGRQQGPAELLRAVTQPWLSHYRRWPGRYRNWKYPDWAFSSCAAWIFYTEFQERLRVNITDTLPYDCIIL